LVGNTLILFHALSDLIKVVEINEKFDLTSAQYKFINEDLKKASENKDVDSIVVTTYGPFYTSPSTHKAEKDLRDVYHPIFEKYNVDLVLQAHNHNYQRTYPISYNSAGDSSEPIVTNQLITGYNNHTDGDRIRTNRYRWREFLSAC
jgi:hypothetical protein